MSTVKSFKIGDTSYPVQDTKASQLLSSTDTTTLLANGTYRGEVVENNTVFLSSDGSSKLFTKTVTGITFDISHTAISAASDVTYFSSVAAINGYICAVAAGSGANTAYISSDEGTNWSTITLPYTYPETPVIMGNKYISGGYNEAYLYSTEDFEHWTQIVIPAADYKSFAYNGTALVGLCRSMSTNGVIVSYDGGSTWTKHNLPTTASGNWTIAVGDDGYIMATASGNLIGSSDNGETWSTLSMPSLGGNATSLVYTNGFFYISRGTSSMVPVAFKSTNNGATWTSATTPWDTKEAAKAFVVNDLLFMTDGRNDLYYSFDGLTWSLITDVSGYNSFKELGCYLNEKYWFSRNYGKFDKDTAVENATYALTPLSYTKSEIDAIAPVPYEVVQTLPGSPTTGKIYFVTGS